MAGGASGFYLGAGIGHASVGNLEQDDDELSFDGDDLGFKLFAGYNFGLIPFLELAVEGGYIDFGKPDDVIEDTRVELDLDGLTLVGLVGLKLGPVDLFAKAGAISWDAKAASGTESASDVRTF